MGRLMRMTDSGGKECRRQLHGQLCEPPGSSDAEDGPGAGDDDGFDEQLADDAPAAGADGRAHGELMLAGAAAREQKDGAVGATDDEEQQYAGEQKHESAAGVLLIRHDDGLELQMPLLGKVVGILLCELADDGVEFRIRGSRSLYAV